MDVDVAAILSYIVLLHYALFYHFISFKFKFKYRLATAEKLLKEKRRVCVFLSALLISLYFCYFN